MNFAGSNPFKNHTDNYYILVSVERYSRFHTAQVYKNFDASTAIKYLEEYCRLHGIHRSISIFFGRKPNTALSNIVTKPSKQNLSYKQIKNFASDRRLLKQPVLSPAAIWDMDQDSEPKLNIHYREAAQKETQSGNNTATENQDFENAPLLSPTRTPGKTIQSKIEITFGDKTSAVIYGRKQLARKTIARKAPEPRGTLKNHNATS